jgi:hypothetical protein
MAISKYIFTKTQAVSSLAQIDQGNFQDHLKPVSPTHHYFKLTCEQLEKMLLRANVNISTVVDDPEPVSA